MADLRKKCGSHQSISSKIIFFPIQSKFWVDTRGKKLLLKVLPTHTKKIFYNNFQHRQHFCKIAEQSIRVFYWFLIEVGRFIRGTWCRWKLWIIILLWMCLGRSFWQDLILMFFLWASEPSDESAESEDIQEAQKARSTNANISFVCADTINSHKLHNFLPGFISMWLWRAWILTVERTLNLPGVYFFNYLRTDFATSNFWTLRTWANSVRIPKNKLSHSRWP